LYRKEPEKLSEIMKEQIDIPAKPKEMVKEEQPKRRISILELLGNFKFIREK
jgi:hypothetical protein